VDVTLTEKQVEKIADPAVKAALQKRLADGGGNPKESFKNIGIDPVFAGGPFPVKRVRVKNPAEKMIALPRGYAEPGSNHHIAIYKDGNGKKQEHVVTFWDAFQRMRLGIPAIIKDTKAAYGLIENAEDGKFPDDFYLPGYDWEFITSLQSNDMFVFGLDPKEVDFRAAKNQKMVSKALFRVRKLSSGNYWFMHHLETEILEDTESKALGRCKQCSPSSLEGERGIKVKLNRLGKVTQTGE
jgi:CRISPR-associated endonuclease Csn1